MKISLVFISCVLVCMLITCDQADAWFGNRSRPSYANRAKQAATRHVARFVGRTVKAGVKAAGNFVAGAAKGTVAMAKAYKDMRQANWKNSDKYFHARGNYDAAKHGAGGKWAAKVISNARENIQQKMGESAADSAADQKANKWGRNGGNPNRYRPAGLPKKYRK